MNSDKELDITIYEDIEHLSDLWQKEKIKNSDIRNSVHILRRLLIYGDLQKSANSRKFPLIIESPDVNPFVKASRYGLIEFFQSAGTQVLGLEIAGFTVQEGQSHRLNRILREHNPENRISLNIQSFLRQNVFSFKGELITRADVIKYVCNKAGNAHFDRNRDATIDKIRTAIEIKLTEDGITQIGFNLDSINNPEISFEPTPGNIDPVFIEVAAAAKFLTSSKSIIEYCELLKQEYGL